MEEEKRKAYSEVVEILKWTDEEKLEKIPFEVVELIKNNMDPTYRPQISTQEPLENQNLRQETYSILTWLATKYWGSDSTEKAGNKTETESQAVEEQTVNIIKTEENMINVEENIVEEEEKVDHTEEIAIRNAAVYNDMDLDALGENRLERDKILPIVIGDLKWYERMKIRIIEFIKRIFRGSKKNIGEGVQE